MTVGPDGLSAGEIARRLGVQPATLSFHLQHLERAGLLTRHRRSRQIVYAPHVDGVRRLLTFLTQDCCQGRPEICGDIADAAQVCAAGPSALPPGGESAAASPGRPEMAAPQGNVAPRYNVLFLCTHNSARSIMAECILTRIGQGTFRAFSAGAHPSGALNPDVVDLLHRSGFDTTELRSKSWDAFARPGDIDLDFVFTLCDRAAGEPCPVWPGQPMTAHWPFPDPALFQGGEAERRAFIADIFKQIQTRLSIFVNLPIASLDRLSLQRRLDEMAHAPTTQPS
jgi:arsenate reductase